MAQLLNIRKMDIGRATEYLNARNWEFLEAEEEEETTLGTISFGYNKNYYNDNAESFLYYYFSEEYDLVRLSIQVHKKNKFTEYLNAIKSYGCKLINSTVKDGRVIQTYQGATTTFIISSYTTKNSYNVDSGVWNITLRGNNDD